MPVARHKDPIEVASIHEVNAEAEALADDDGNIDKEDAEKLGGVNAEAVVQNRRNAAIVGKKRAGTKGVAWGQENASSLYDQVIQLYPPSSMNLQVSQLTGSKATWYLQGQPRSGAELYSVIQKQCHGRKEETEYKVVMSDISSHMNRGVGRITLPSTLDEPGVPPPVQAQGLGAPPPAAYVPPPPPPAIPRGPNGEVWVAEARAWCIPVGMQPPPPPPLAAPPAPAPAPVAPAPTPPPPPGAVFHVPGVGWVQAAQAPVQPQAPTKPMSPAEQWAGAIGQVKQVVEFAREAQTLVPGAVAVEGGAEPDDDSPIVTIDIGDYKVVQNKKNGSIRPVETALANGEKIMTWISKQQEQYQQHQARMQQPQQLSSPQQPGVASTETPETQTKQQMSSPTIPGVT